MGKKKYLITPDKLELKKKKSRKVKFMKRKWKKKRPRKTERKKYKKDCWSIQIHIVLALRCKYTQPGRWGERNVHTFKKESFFEFRNYCYYSYFFWRFHLNDPSYIISRHIFFLAIWIMMMSICFAISSKLSPI